MSQFNHYQHPWIRRGPLVSLAHVAQIGDRATPSMNTAWTKFYSRLVIVTVIGLQSACSTGPDYNGHGIIYGCDGSGAGIVLRWGPSARQGMVDAGYPGIFHPFRWQTGAGMAIDHMTSVGYKRWVASKLANQIMDHRARYPEDPIYIGAFSAGCAVAVYALEQLPEDVLIDQCVLLSSSVSASYDLTMALTRIRGKLYVTTSPHDEMLKRLVAAVGSADRERVGDRLSGIEGFTIPTGADEATREAYAKKVQTIPWSGQFIAYGNHGRHSDMAGREFIANVIAPLIVPAR